MPATERLDTTTFKMWQNANPHIDLLHVSCGHYLRPLTGAFGAYIWCQECDNTYLVTKEKLDNPDSELVKDCKAEFVEVYRIDTGLTVDPNGNKSHYSTTVPVSTEDLISYRQKHGIHLGGGETVEW